MNSHIWYGPTWATHLCLWSQIWISLRLDIDWAALNWLWVNNLTLWSLMRLFYWNTFVRLFLQLMVAINIQIFKRELLIAFFSVTQKNFRVHWIWQGAWVKAFFVAPVTSLILFTQTWYLIVQISLFRSLALRSHSSFLVYLALLSHFCYTLISPLIKAVASIVANHLFY